MAPPEGIETASGRLATFEIAHASKRRASSTKKKGATTIKWPHKHPDPEALSQAGFYYCPSSSSPDNCACFTCGVNLDGWEAEDEPALEHWSVRKDCAWAMVCYVKQQFKSETNEIADEDPMSEVYVNARTATFQDWPHESKKGWKCKIAKMVAAGWHFDPSTDMDDAVSCAYCHKAIGGWERKDDPFKEHFDRNPECPFFILDQQFKATRPKTKKPRTSKASRASTQSNVSLQLDNISLPDFEDPLDLEEGEDDTMLTTISTASKAPRGRKTATATKATKTTKGRAKKTAVINDSEIFEDEIADGVPPEPVRQTRRKASRQVSAQVDNSTVEAEARPKRTRSKKVAATAEPIIDENEPPKRGKKRTSAGVEKENSFASDVTVITAPKSRKATTSKQAMADSTSKRIASVQKLDASIMMLDEAPEIFEDPKPKRAKKTKKQSSTREPLQEIPVQDVQMEDDFPNLQSDMLLDASTSTPKQTPEPQSQDENASPPPPSPTPARRSISGSKRLSSRRSILTPRPITKKVITPELSPQSSDAENKPPSARPEVQQGLTLNAISPIRIPLTSTPKQSSPSKHAVSRLNSSFPWSPSDLEAVFLSASPRKQGALADKENFLPGGRNLDIGKKSLAEVVLAVKETLTRDERNMDVQSWLRLTASKGGDVLKAKCEGMVTLFERDGAKASRALEGIQVSR